jgi:hypothetical protein
MEEYEIERGKRQEIKPTVLAWGGFITALVVIRILFVLLTPLVARAYNFLTSDAMSRFYLVMGISTVALGLFLFRKYARLAYGICEVAFGIVSAWSIAEHAGEANPRFDLIALMGVLYLIVRGLDNCAIGMEERATAKELAMDAT